MNKFSRNWYAVLVLSMLFVATAHAEMPDVIGVLTDEINDEGELSLEIHANSTPHGATLEQSYQNEVLNNHGLRLTPSLSYGLPSNVELTVSAPIVREGNMGVSTTSFAGVRGRLTWIAPGEEGRTTYAYWGTSTSVLMTSEKFDYGKTLWDIGLIGGYRTPDWHFATNAFIANGMANGLGSMGVDYSLDGKLINQVADRTWAGVELYSARSKAMTVDGVGWFTTRSLFGTVEYEGKEHSVQFGVGKGLNGNSDPWTLKFSDFIAL